VPPRDRRPEPPQDCQADPNRAAVSLDGLKESRQVVGQHGVMRSRRSKTEQDFPNTIDCFGLLDVSTTLEVLSQVVNLMKAPFKPGSLQHAPAAEEGAVR
jgi:hypothetical protein